jgi:hypothetical protein
VALAQAWARRRFDVLDMHFKENRMRPTRLIRIAVISTLFVAASLSGQARALEGATTVTVAGTGYDDLRNAIVHWQKPTAAGLIQQSTEIIELNGDLRGRVLYHVTTEIDFVNGTLVNTGEQVYSGTVAGSAPVLIHDDQFRFEVNLVTGQETGQVFLLNHIAGPKVRCTLKVIGTGLNADGNPTFSYSGECTFRGD